MGIGDVAKHSRRRCGSFATSSYSQRLRWSVGATPAIAVGDVGAVAEVLACAVVGEGTATAYAVAGAVAGYPQNLAYEDNKGDEDYYRHGDIL